MTQTTTKTTTKTTIFNSGMGTVVADQTGLWLLVPADLEIIGVTADGDVVIGGEEGCFAVQAAGLEDYCPDFSDEEYADWCAFWATSEGGCAAAELLAE